MTKFKKGDLVTVKENIEEFVAGIPYQVKNNSMYASFYVTDEEGEDWEVNNGNIEFIPYTKPVKNVVKLEELEELTERERAIEYLKKAIKTAKPGELLTINPRNMLEEVYGLKAVALTIIEFVPVTKK